MKLKENTEKTVLARIRRMDKQFASCGVPVRPPEHMRQIPGIRRLCPKLVPGQVIRVPVSHNLLNQPAIEIVRRIEKDEFERPWVFETMEQAVMANPSKSRLGADQIAEGLAMTQGAIRNAPERRRKLQEEAAAEAEDRDAGEAFEDEDDEDDFTKDDGYQPTAQNRVTREEADELRGRDEEPEEQPVTRRSRTRRR